jgi:recombination protein RecR
MASGPNGTISDPLAGLVAALQRLPGIGAKSAQRLAFHLLKTPREDVDGLCAAMLSVKDRVTYCSNCSNITDTDPCGYCTDAGRDGRIICVVEQPENVWAVERTRGFRGRYHVLMGAIAPLQGIGPDDLKIKGLLTRVGSGGVEEIILATNPTVEGEATALYLARLLKPLGVRVSRIAMGVPVGSDLDYTDEFTMSKAMEGRREM